MSPHDPTSIIPSAPDAASRDKLSGGDDGVWGSVPYAEYNVAYKIYGTGSQVLLLLPGAIGSLETDFAEQLAQHGGLSRDEFTIVAVDLPGYGRSRPPEKRYSSRVYEIDGEAALAVLDSLCHRTFSILGWSDGGKVALVMAIQYRARVDKIAIWGTLSYATPTDVTLVTKTRDLTKWDPVVKARYEAVYGPDLYAHLWAVYMSYCERVCVDYEWDLRADLPNIRSAVLVLHGERDPMVQMEHPEAICRLVADSRLERFPTGSHNIHQTHTDEFNAMITEFFLE